MCLDKSFPYLLSMILYALISSRRNPVLSLPVLLECSLYFANGISKKVAKADLKVFLTPIVFGGYSSELKKAVDRQLGVLLPFCNKIQGEVHFFKPIWTQRQPRRYRRITQTRRWKRVDFQNPYRSECHHLARSSAFNRFHLRRG